METEHLGGEERGRKEGLWGTHVEGTQFLTRGAPGILDPSCSFQITVFLFVLDTWLFSLVSADNVILLYFPSIPPSRYF